jgi:flagellar protein FlbD
MIQLTRLNNARLAVNCDLIKYVEEAPDTVLTLVSGEKLVVRETTEQVIEQVRAFRRSILAQSASEFPGQLAARRDTSSGSLRSSVDRQESDHG